MIKEGERECFSKFLKVARYKDAMIVKFFKNRGVTITKENARNLYRRHGARIYYYVNGDKEICKTKKGEIIFEMNYETFKRI